MVYMKNLSTYVAVVIGIIVSIVFVGFAMTSAHGTGLTLEEMVDGGFVDIGVSVTEITDDTSAVFDFSLFETEGGEEVAFTDIWVRLVRDDTTVFASGIHNARLGGALMTYTFPTAGSYNLIVRFQDDGRAVAQATFPLEVKKGKNDTTQQNIQFAVAGLLGAIVALAGHMFIRKIRHA